MMRPPSDALGAPPDDHYQNLWPPCSFTRTPKDTFRETQTTVKVIKQ